MSVPVAPIPGLEEAIEQRKKAQESAPTTPAQGAVIPPAAVPWLTGLVAVALVVSRVASPHTDAAQVAGAVTDVAVLFGLLSPGMRRK